MEITLINRTNQDVSVYASLFQKIAKSAEKILELPERTKLQILSPIVRGQKGTHKKTLEGLKKEGFVRDVSSNFIPKCSSMQNNNISCT